MVTMRKGKNGEVGERKEEGRMDKKREEEEEEEEGEDGKKKKSQGTGNYLPLIFKVYF